MKERGITLLSEEVKKEERRFRIPCKARMRYYAPLLDVAVDDKGKPVQQGKIVKMGNEFFAVFSVPADSKFDPKRPIVSIGIALALTKHAATVYNNGNYEHSLFYNTTKYDKLAKKYRDSSSNDCLLGGHSSAG